MPNCDTIDLFKDLSQDDRDEINLLIQYKSYGKGSEVFNKASTNRMVYFVVSGTVSVVNFSISGREIAYAKKNAGEFFGEISAIDENKRSAAVVSLTPSVLGVMDPDDFRACLSRHPSVALKVMNKLCAVIRSCDERIMDLATLSAYQRVYRELLDIKRPDPVNPNSWLIYPLPTQAQIASTASTTRETVARVLGSLAQGEIVQRKGRTLYIRDLEKLEVLAERQQVASA